MAQLSSIFLCILFNNFFLFWLFSSPLSIIKPSLGLYWVYRDKAYTILIRDICCGSCSQSMQGISIGYEWLRFVPIRYTQCKTQSGFIMHIGAENCQNLKLIFDGMHNGRKMRKDSCSMPPNHTYIHVDR